MKEPSLPRTFRATAEAWLGRLALPFGFFAAFIITAVNTGSLDKWVGAGLLAILTGIYSVEYLRPMLSNWLKVDARSLEGSLNGRCFEIYWSEVLAVWMLARRRGPALCLGTRAQTYLIPLRFLDPRGVWEAVQAAAPPDALEADAMRRIPDYPLWAAARSQALDAGEPRVVADHWLVMLFSWSGGMFFFYTAARAWSAGSLPVGLAGLVLGGLCLLPLLGWGITELSSEAVTRRTMFGVRSMAWEDVRRIEIDPTRSRLVLVSQCQQLVIPGPGLLDWSARRAVLSVVMIQAERRGIPHHQTLWALFKFSHGLRRQS